MYECPRCNYETNHKSHMNSHFKRKTICELEKENLSLEECINLLNNGKLHTKYKVVHVCDNCKQTFDRLLRLQDHKEKCKNDPIKEKCKNDPIKELRLQLDDLQKVVDSRVTSLLPKKEIVHHVYIIHEREFVNSGQPIYKIGKTVNPKSRMGSYPKGSNIKILLDVNDCHESEKLLIAKFDETFVNRPDVGREYYQGEIKSMIKETFDICC